MLDQLSRFLGLDFKRWLKEHNHDGINSSRDKNIELRKTVDTPPTYIPTNEIEAKIRYKNGSIYRVYEYFEDGWHYTTYT